MHWKETTRHSQVQKDSAWLNWESLSNSEQWEEATLKLQTFKETQKDILNNSILSFHITAGSLRVCLKKGHFD